MRLFPKSDRKKWNEKIGWDSFALHNKNITNCSKWSVVTTIFPPGKALEIQAALKNWCIVIVGDEKGPPPNTFFESSNRIHFLNASIQKQFYEKINPFIKGLKWNHFGRKNLGYLFAIANGANEIWDFDDDNMLLNSEAFDNGYGNYIAC